MISISRVTKYVFYSAETGNGATEEANGTAVWSCRGFSVIKRAAAHMYAVRYTLVMLRHACQVIETPGKERKGRQTCGCRRIDIGVGASERGY